MPISLMPTDAETRLTAVGTGNITLNDLKTFVASARTGEQRRFPLLLDLSQATTDMHSSDVQNFASLLAQHTKQTGRRGRVAVFAFTDEFYGVLRMLMSYCEIVGIDHVAVFRSRSEAEAWLGEMGRSGAG
jgi:hypothetical protein